MTGLVKKRRILMISSWFPADVGRRGLMNELADSFVESDLDVDVLALDWRDVDIATQPIQPLDRQGLAVFRVQPVNFKRFGSIIQLVVKWIASPIKAVPQTISLLKNNRYDLIVSGMPSALWAPVLICILFSRSKKYLIQWDFMPYHHRAIGIIPSGLVFYVFLLLERCLIRGFNVIGCMSEKNIEFLKAHYWLGKNQKVEILPIWTEAKFPEKADRAEVRADYKLPLNAKIAVFGGTLSKGRGLDDILAAAAILEKKSPEVMFLIVGRGPLEFELKQKAKSQLNVKVISALPRSEYLKLISACDCGIVATQRDTGVPTFPSKTLDYFRAGIPVVASVEDSTDFGIFLMEKEAGVVARSGDAEELATKIIELTSDKKRAEKITNNSRNLVENYFNVQSIVHQILGSLA